MNHEKPPLDEVLLMHYGIKGMRWGVIKKEDPAQRRSTSEYKAIRPKFVSPKEASKSIQKVQTRSLEKVNPDKKGLTPGQKKALYITLGVVGAAAIVGGAVYAKKSGVNLNSFGPLSQKYLEETALAKKNAWSSLDSFIQPSSYSRPEFTLPKGHTFHRISSAAESSFGKVTYSTHSADDMRRYLGHGYGSMLERGNPLHHITFSANGPVKVPNLTTTLDTLREVLVAERGGAVSKDDVLRTYTQMAGGYWDDNTATNLFKSLSSKGYGALVDEMDAGVVSDSPLIVFAKHLFSSKVSSPVTLKDVAEARNLTIPLKAPKL